MGSTSSRVRRGHFIAFTGTDGAGKSTQASLLARRLNDSRHQTYVTEGKDDFNGEVLRRWSADSGYELPPETFQFVWALDTLENISRHVHPMLAGGINVVAPRSVYCQIAIARALGIATSDLLESLLSFYGFPELVIMLDVPVATTVARLEERGFDSEDPELMRRFREELLAIAEDRGFVVVNGSADRYEVHKMVWDVVTQQLDGLS